MDSFMLYFEINEIKYILRKIIHQDMSLVSYPVC